MNYFNPSMKIWKRYGIEPIRWKYEHHVSSPLVHVSRDVFKQRKSENRTERLRKIWRKMPFRTKRKRPQRNTSKATIAQYFAILAQYYAISSNFDFGFWKLRSDSIFSWSSQDLSRRIKKLIEEIPGERLEELLK